MARFKILGHSDMIRLVCLFCLFFSIAKAEDFPTSISTANYYYTLFASNFKTKLERLHNTFPNRKLTSYWQYSAASICDTLYSHAYIPRTELSHRKIKIEIRITECGQVLHLFYLELYLADNFKLKNNTQSELMKNLLQFKLPDLDFDQYEKIKITAKDNTLEWSKNKDHIIFLTKTTAAYFYREIELKQFSSLRNGKLINHLQTKYLRYKNDALISSNKLLVSYQPLQDDTFPTITYFDEAGNLISSLMYFDSYKYFISSTLNDLIIELTEFDETLFNVNKVEIH